MKYMPDENQMLPVITLTVQQGNTTALIYLQLVTLTGKQGQQKLNCADEFTLLQTSAGRAKACSLYHQCHLIHICLTLRTVISGICQNLTSSSVP